MNSLQGLNIIFLLVILISTSCEKNETKHQAITFGHTGAGIDEFRAPYPPNTDKSIAYALNILDADGVEVDVRFTTDSVAVISHDSNVESITNGTGCIEEMTWSQIQELDYYKKYKIIQLKDVIDLCMAGNKFLFMDIKVNNECAGVDIAPELVNTAVMDALEGLSVEQKKLITHSSRSYEHVEILEDNDVNKAFETNDVIVGLNVWDWGTIDKLVYRYDQLTVATASNFRTEGIPFCVYGMKGQNQIREAYNLSPDEMITDNIPFTKKIMN